MIESFYSYVLSFYSEGQIYDCGMTLDDVISLTQELIEDEDHEFNGDSMDREIIKEMYLSQS